MDFFHLKRIFDQLPHALTQKNKDTLRIRRKHTLLHIRKVKTSFFSMMDYCFSLLRDLTLSILKYVRDIIVEKLRTVSDRG